jgi:hypothetical protein
MKRHIGLAAGAFTFMLGTLGLGYVLAPEASASTNYYIAGIEGESVQNTLQDPQGDIIVYADMFTGQTYTAINEGGSSCDGGTCFHFESTSTHRCLEWGGPPSNSDSNLIEQDVCTGGLSNTYQDFNNPPTNGTFGGWYNLGATDYYNDGSLYGIVWNSSNEYLEVEAHPLQSNPNAAKWALNG